MDARHGTVALLLRRLAWHPVAYEAVMTKDTNMVLRNVLRRGSFLGSSAMVVASMALGTVFATCGSTCGDSGSVAAGPPADEHPDASHVRAADAGAVGDVGPRSKGSSEAATVSAPYDGESQNTAAGGSSVGTHNSGVASSVGAIDGGPSYYGDGGSGDGGLDAIPGPVMDAADEQPAAPNPSCIFNGLSCEGDASDSCCTYCQNGACGGCFARGVQLPADGGTCCPGAGSVITVGDVSYCGTNLCLADGVGCGDAGGKPCCNGQCNGVLCGGV
jgi:hypothetical protein